RAPAGRAHPLPREPRPRRDARARSLPPGGLAGRGLLPRRHRRRRARRLMPHIERTAHVGWDGNLARGAGTLDAASGAFARLPYSLPSRVGEPGGKTSPEELLAAAHGGCLTMSLAGELTTAGTPPGRLDVAVTIVMDEVEGQGHQIVGSRVEIVARVEGVDEAALQAAVVEADAGCPFSQLLKRAGAEVRVPARLA